MRENITNDMQREIVVKSAGAQDDREGTSPEGSILMPNSDEAGRIAELLSQLTEAEKLDVIEWILSALCAQPTASSTLEITGEQGS